jgi:hypothetical protein
LCVGVGSVKQQNDEDMQAMTNDEVRMTNQ